MSRVGNFSSSQIYRLMSKGRGNWSLENIGAAFKSYVKEKQWERKLGRSLSKDVSARPTTWGTLVEQQCFNVLDLKYSLVSKERFKHKELTEYWTGMPDVLTPDLVGDIKCPYTMESFCGLVDALESAESLKAHSPMYYWQLVSNSILCNRENAVLIVYCPLKKDLEEIRELARTEGEQLQNQFAWINWAEDAELPYIPEKSEYTDVNLLEFKVSEQDKELLTERVKLAVNMLNKN